MKKHWKEWVAALLSLALLALPAYALTPEQLGTLLRDHYVEEPPQAVWAEDTVSGMLKALADPFTLHLTAAGREALLTTTREEAPERSSVTFQQDGHVGLLTISTFTEKTYGLLSPAITGHDREVDRWVVDLRGNTGGEVQSAVDAASAFVGSGMLAYLRDNKGELVGVKAEEGALTLDPVIVLVDGVSASGAELYAAAVRDGRAGLIIGSRTYGKGVAQQLHDETTDPGFFPEGDALLLTTYRFFSQQFNSNHILGVIPHLEVPDDLASQVAWLLCAQRPAGSNDGFLRLHVGGWRWYLDLSDAQANAAAFQALLESLPPTAPLYLGRGQDWVATTQSALVAQYAPGAALRVFDDVGNSPYKDAINTLKTYGILKGDGTGRFNPTDTLDRASLCALLAQAMDYPQSENPPAFADTPADAWYTPYVTTLSEMGIINGYDDGLFHPKDTIPHQQFMVILSRVAAYTNHMASVNLAAGPTAEELADGHLNAYDAWARPGAWLLDGRWHAAAQAIDPKGATTREEAAFDLYSALTTLNILS